MEDQDIVHADLLNAAEDLSNEESKYEAVATALQERGVNAEAHQSGGGIMVVRVSKPPYTVLFGTAAEQWGGSVMDENGDYTDRELWTSVPSDNPDPNQVADGIAEAVSKLA